MAAFKDNQIDIHLMGLSGEKPKIPVDFSNLETRAEAEMAPGITGLSLAGPATRDLSVEIFDMRFAFPLFLAPIGVIGPCRPDETGDLETARGATAAGVPMVASNFSNAPMEEVANALGDGTGFFQLYTPNDDALAESLVARAEAAGFKALVVTLDAWTLG